MRSVLLLAILSISSSLASATFCFPRSSPYAVPISALELGSQFLPFLPRSHTATTSPVQKSIPPTPAPEPPSVTKPETTPTPAPGLPPIGKIEGILTPSKVPHAGGSVVGSISSTVGGAFTGAFAKVIKSLCAKTDDPELCVSSIKPRIGTIKVSFDATGVLKLAMQALKEQTDLALKTTRTYILDYSETNKLAAAALKDCVESYEDAKFTLNEVDGALQSGDKGTVGSLLSSVGTDYDTCENGFDDFGIESVMADFDSKLMKLNSICLAIAKAANLMD